MVGVTAFDMETNCAFGLEVEPLIQQALAFFRTLTVVVVDNTHCWEADSMGLWDDHQRHPYMQDPMDQILELDHRFVQLVPNMELGQSRQLAVSSPMLVSFSRQRKLHKDLL